MLHIVSISSITLHPLTLIAHTHTYTRSNCIDGRFCSSFQTSANTPRRQRHASFAMGMTDNYPQRFLNDGMRVLSYAAD